MLLQLAFSLICLALGASGGYVAGLFKVGWWFADETDAIQARESLKNLQDLTSRVTGQVEEHARRVESAQKDLEAASSSETTSEEAVGQAAQALQQANEQLQAELRKAKRDLERQQSELQSHRREARTDGLTQLLNRRAFDEEMDRLPQRIASSGVDAALLLLDIDHFKKFNDTYGHQLGDRVLKHVADVVRRTLTGMDVIAARYGGEEFAIILSSSPLIAARTAEELRSAVETSSLKHEGKTLSITLSVGVSQTATGLDAEEVISRADDGLYAAKRNGRNRGYFHDGDALRPLADVIAQAGRPTALPEAAEDRTELAEEDRVCDALTELEATLNDAAQNALTPGRERRRYERQPYSRRHLIAPIVGGRVPSPEMFGEAQFFDLSTGGFGLLMETPPTFKSFIVALDKHDGTVFAIAEVVRMRRSESYDDAGARLWEVGCRFMGKLQSTRVASHAPMA